MSLNERQERFIDENGSEMAETAHRRHAKLVIAKEQLEVLHNVC
ncbi:hypothetical protein [Weissella cibaria]|nr:hypothetical protein [Weissella cibaria]DAW30129.1 MAG TPA: hypothetical protein [Caudoviricetes sp.]